MNELNKWWLAIVFTGLFSIVTMFVGWNSWMTLQLVSHSATISQLSMSRDNVIPEVVEKSLAEIRNKTNEQYTASTDSNAKLLELYNAMKIDVRDTQKDVAQIKEILTKKNP